MKRRSALLLAMLLAFAWPAKAEEEQKETAETPSTAAPAARTVEEIIVTAQKKEQNLEEVPISITAI